MSNILVSQGREKSKGKRVFNNGTDAPQWGAIPSTQQLLKLAIFAFENPAKQFVMPATRPEAKALLAELFPKDAKPARAGKKDAPVVAKAATRKRSTAKA